MIIHMKWLIRNIILMFIGLSLFSCKATTFKKVTINASKEEVWSTISKLGDLDHYSALDSASLTPSGTATEGAIHFVAQGKNYAKSKVVFVEDLKTIKTKLIETSWPADYWNESWHVYDDVDGTGLKYVIDFKIKGFAKIGYPILRLYNSNDMGKTIQNIKEHIETNL